MCIAGSVGRNGKNDRADTKIVQVLLNANASRFDLGEPLAEDGLYGSRTESGIRAFHVGVLGAANPELRVDPGGRALAALAEGLPRELDTRALQGIMAHSSSERVERYARPLIERMAANGIDSARRRRHFLAQIGHESGGLRYTEELASGDAYEGRIDLGNTEPGDGPRFKGRGLIQLTGRANYAAYGAEVGLDLLGDARESLSHDPLRAVDVACWFWRAHGLNALADRDDLEAVTRRLNGGLNGLDDRAAYLERARFFVRD